MTVDEAVWISLTVIYSNTGDPASAYTTYSLKDNYLEVSHNSVILIGCVEHVQDDIIKKRILIR